MSLSVRLGSDGRQFDLNSNGEVDELDRMFWVSDIANTYFGRSGPIGDTALWLPKALKVVCPRVPFLWVSDIANTYFGDSNLDGEFNSEDLVAVFQASEYEDDMEGNSTWATGDWNGDSEFDSSDLVFAFQDGGYEIGPRIQAQSVPEPPSILLTLAGVLITVLSRHRPI